MRLRSIRCLGNKVLNSVNHCVLWHVFYEEFSHRKFSVRCHFHIKERLCQTVLDHFQIGVFEMRCGDLTSSTLVCLCSEKYHPLTGWKLLKNLLMFTFQPAQSATLLPQKILNVRQTCVYNYFGTLISKIRNTFLGVYLPHLLHTHAFARHYHRLFIIVTDRRRKDVPHVISPAHVWKLDFWSLFLSGYMNLQGILQSRAVPWS